MQTDIFKIRIMQWLEEKKLYIKESTYAIYKENIVNHLLAEFGEYPIDKIKSETIQSAVCKWAAEGGKNKNKGLSEKTIKGLVVLLKTFLRDIGADEKQISRKIVYSMANKETTVKRFTLSNLEQKKFVSVVKENIDSERCGYLICIYTGMRIGEICALEWKDIDFKNDLIYVNKTLQRIYIKDIEGKGKSKIVISVPKSRHSCRSIPLASALRDILLLFRGDDEEYVLTKDYKYIEPRLYRKHYKDFLKKYHLEDICFHGLRHSFATRCIEMGADCKTVSELLGHSSVNITLNLYVHPPMEEKRKCIEALKF